MPASSLFQFAKSRPEENLHWFRADIDGAPFRGTPIPGLTEDEAESRLVPTARPFNRMFDLSKPEDNKDYLLVLAKATNKAGEILFIKRHSLKSRKKNEDGTSSLVVQYQAYVEWVEFEMVDGMPMQSQRPYIGKVNE